MGSELTRFFAAWVPVLRGESSVAECRQTLGSSRSAPADLAFYRVLMERNAAHLLSALFPATRAAVIEHLPGCWLSWVADYARTTECAHWNPNEWGRAFPDFIAELALMDETLPAAIVELADYEWLNYAIGAGVDPERANGSTSEPPSYAVRQYDFDVPRLAREQRRGASWSTSQPSPVIVIVYRDPETEHARVYYPSRAALLVLADRAMLAVGRFGFECSPEELRSAEEELSASGVLGASRHA